MDPSDTNWLPSLVSNMHQIIDARYDIIQKLLCKYESDDDFVHFYIHSSGLFYGYVNRHLLSKFPAMKTWSVADHYKIALTEGLFVAYLFRYKSKFLQSKNKNVFIEEALQKIFEFYVLYTIDESFFKRRKQKFTFRK